MRDALELSARRLDDARVTVAGVLDRDAAREVHVASALDVPQERVLGARDEYRVGHRDAARDRRLAPRDQGFVAVHGPLLTDKIVL